MDADLPLAVVSVSEVQYQLASARIYDILSVVLSVSHFRNSSSVPVTTTISMQYEDIKRCKWAATAGVLPGTVTRLVAGIPILESEETVVVPAGSEFNDTYTWASTATLDTQVSYEYTVTVPPMSTVKVSLEVTQGSIDVPFSYLKITAAAATRFGDGTYTGTNLFNFNIKTEQTDEALDAVEISN